MTREDKNLLLMLSKNTLSKSLGLSYKDIDATSINQQRGAFVTLKEKGSLRGCIGYIFGIKPLYQEIIDLTLDAAFNDYRFPPLVKEEFEFIDIEISVLSEPQLINDLSEFKLSRDGIIIAMDNKKAVFLPQVADETGWSKDELLKALCRKARLDKNAYKSKDADFLTFQAEVFS
ncbi:MAG: AmmeMemoRadiSam system protein A [Pleomorphochaeta sp.]